MQKTHKITIYGAGYVGLVTAACFAELGYQVLVVEVDKTKIDLLNQGISPIYEPDLEGLLQRHLATGHLMFSQSSKLGVEHGLYQMIAVGTPSNLDGSPDMSYVLSVATDIGEYISEYRLIINKSTSPIGAVDQITQVIRERIEKRSVNVDFDVASNPEFLAQGLAIHNFMHPDRIVVGVNHKRAENLMTQLYAPLDDSAQLLKIMDIPSAELTKYAANAFLAMRISFINEMSQLSEQFGADIESVRQGIGSDPRIGSYFLHAGCGFGGSCFPKDIRALRWMAEQSGYQAAILEAIEEVNRRQKKVLFRKIANFFKENLENKIIAVWGLAFKPDTDDMREASSRVLIDDLLEAGATIKAYDPVAHLTAQCLYEGRSRFEICHQAYEALDQAHAMVVVTEWNEFRNPDFDLIANKLLDRVIFDGRNLYKKEVLSEYGLKYFSIGRR